MPFRPEKVQPGIEVEVTERNIEGLARLVNQLEGKVGGPGTTLSQTIIAAITNITNNTINVTIGAMTDDAEDFALMVGGDL